MSLVGYRQSTHTNAYQGPYYSHFGTSNTKSRLSAKVTFPSSKRSVTYHKCLPSSFPGQTLTIRFVLVMTVVTFRESTTQNFNCISNPVLSATVTTFNTKINVELATPATLTHADLLATELLKMTVTITGGK